ncbi:hypothetical protein D3C84_1230640 [compost metagenome]
MAELGQIGAILRGEQPLYGYLLFRNAGCNPHGGFELRSMINRILQLLIIIPLAKKVDQ